MNKIIEIKFGSHLYGTDTLNSDLDIKAVYLPEARDICLGTVKRNICTHRPKQHGERNTKDDVDVEVFSLGEYLKLLLEGQTMALDMLFALQRPEMVQRFAGAELFDHIHENRFRLLNRQVNAFL